MGVLIGLGIILYILISCLRRVDSVTEIVMRLTQCTAVVPKPFNVLKSIFDCIQTFLIKGSEHSEHISGVSRSLAL